MRAWALMLGGLVIWALHFFLLYGIGSVLPGRGEASWLIVGATFPALAADALIMREALRALQDRNDALGAWIGNLGTLGAAVSAVAILWQCIPALAL